MAAFKEGAVTMEAMVTIKAFFILLTHTLGMIGRQGYLTVAVCLLQVRINQAAISVALLHL